MKNKLNKITLYILSLQILLITSLNSFAETPTSQLPPAGGERPDFTAGADTIADGHIQLETGFTRSLEENINNFNVGGLLRFGAGENFEYRINTPLYIRDNQNDGFSDFGVGTKWKFIEEKDDSYIPALALISGISIPSGHNNYKSDNPELSLSLEASKDITDKIGMNANIVNTDGNEWGYAISANYDTGTIVSPYFELFRVSPRDNWMDTGFTFQVDNDTVLDITYGKQLSGVGNDGYWGFGLVKRW